MLIRAALDSRFLNSGGLQWTCLGQDSLWCLTSSIDAASDACPRVRPLFLSALVWCQLVYSKWLQLSASSRGNLLVSVVVQGASSVAKYHRQSYLAPCMLQCRYECSQCSNVDSPACHFPMISYFAESHSSVTCFVSITLIHGPLLDAACNSSTFGWFDLVSQRSWCLRFRWQSKQVS